MRNENSTCEARCLAAIQPGPGGALGHAVAIELILAAAELRASVFARITNAGLTLEGFLALAAVRRAEPAPALPATIAGESATTPARLAHTLARLEISKLISCSQEAGNHPRVEVRLSQRGRDLLHDAIARCDALAELIENRLGDIAARHLLELCTTVGASLPSGPHSFSNKVFKPCPTSIHSLPKSSRPQRSWPSALPVAAGKRAVRPRSRRRKSRS